MRKRGVLCLMCLLFCLLFSACGNRDEERQDSRTVSGEAEEGDSRSQSSTSQNGVSQSGNAQSGSSGEYSDISTTTRQVFDLLESDWESALQTEGRKHGSRPDFLGMQFYQGEPVQLWSAIVIPEGASEGEEILTDIFLWKEDGSAQLLLQDQPQDYRSWEWLLGADGTFWLYHLEEILVLDSGGGEVIRQKTNYYNEDICQLSDGRVYFLQQSRENSSDYRVAEFDQTKGTFTSVKDDFTYGRPPKAIGEGENGILYMDMDGFWEVNLADKTSSAYLLFEGTTYYDSYDRKLVQAMRAADGGVDILRSDGRTHRAGSEENQGSGEVETVRMADVGQERIPITLRGLYFNDRWMKDQINRFNASREDYYVVLEEWEDGTEYEDFVNKTQVEIATGKGPDLLCGELLEESIYSLVQKGVFEDLKPYMDRSGIREEDYFPLAFSSWRDGDQVYSINSLVKLEGYRIREDVLGSRTEPDIQTLIDALLAYGEDAIYLYNVDSYDLIRLFLEGSEDLWGMVSWEEGTCDFSGELFAGILETAKRYGYDDRHQYAPVAQIRVCDSIVLYDSLAEQEKEGMVTSGIMFDDGCHAGARAEYFILSMNANSAHKEGAWEFLKFLLGEEAQSSMEYSLPVYKKAFEAEAQGYLSRAGEEGSDRPQAIYSNVNGQMVLVAERSINDLTEEKVEEMRRTLEEAKPFPTRPVPVLDIICEEVADYFGGTKSIEEVRTVIENRVRLYLGENM